MKTPPVLSGGERRTPLSRALRSVKQSLVPLSDPKTGQEPPQRRLKIGEEPQAPQDPRRLSRRPRPPSTVGNTQGPKTPTVTGYVFGHPDLQRPVQPSAHTVVSEPPRRPDEGLLVTGGSTPGEDTHEPPVVGPE